MNSNCHLKTLKWMFDLGANAGLDLFCLVQQVAPGRVLVECPALARAHGNLPIDTCGFISLGCSLIAGVSKDNCFLAVQQRLALSDGVDVGRCPNDGVSQTGLGIHPEGWS